MTVPDHPRAGGEHGTSFSSVSPRSGSSPRRRGTPVEQRAEWLECRIIPAQAGNTGDTAARSVSPRSGSSPRRRGTPTRTGCSTDICRIIPAQAGNTPPPDRSSTPRPDHPRAGGEHRYGVPRHAAAVGSSPRRRGTQPITCAVSEFLRIIPAQAGNTTQYGTLGGGNQDHPRAGGEHEVTLTQQEIKAGSSPRRRGTRRSAMRSRWRRRIIPAQAGNTAWRPRPRPPRADHPRAGGEHASNSRIGSLKNGSSPRRRGTLGRVGQQKSNRRIIPAQAGNTCRRWCIAVSRSDHTRAGGEHPNCSLRSGTAAGSSPRRRGTPCPEKRHPDPNRIIPAQAGNTLPWISWPPRVADHPRAGGEHSAELIAESRARRIIPAQAGNTPVWCAY